MKDSQGYLSQQIGNISELQVTATPGAISNATLVLASSQINQKTTYTLSFMLQSPLPSTGVIYIYFPAEIALDPRNGQCSITSTDSDVLPSALCVSDTSTLSIQNAFASSFSGNATISVEIPNVKNPSSTKPPAAFTIETRDNLKSNSGVVVDQSAALFLVTSLTPGNINSGAAESSNVITAANPTAGAVTTYNFVFTIANSILQNGYLQVSFPKTVSVSSNSQLSDIVGFYTAPSITVDPIDGKITITNGFANASSPSNLTLKFSISNITNPRSFAPSNGFTFTTYDADGYIIDQTSSSLSVSMSIAAVLDTRTSVVPDSLINSASTDYTFMIYPTIPILSTDFITVIFPSTIFFENQNIQCVTADPNIQKIDQCSAGGANAVSLGLSFSSSPISSSFSFKIKNVTNAFSTKPSGSFQIVVTDNGGFIVQQLLSSLVITTNTASNIAPATTVTLSSYSINSTANYMITVNTTVDLPQNYYILITFPSDITSISQPQITGNLGASNLLLINQKLKIYSLPQAAKGQTLNFTLSSFTNSLLSAGSRTLTIEFYTTDDYIIHSTFAGINMGFTCSSPCQSCYGIATNCTSCVESYPFFYLNNCYSACPSGTVDNGAKTCISCDPLSHCNTCTLTNLSTCITCTSTYNLLSSIDMKCYSSCPAGLYATQSQCLPCGVGSNCATCNSSNPSQCLTCSSTYNLFSESDSKCYSASCPEGTTLSESGNICKQCKASLNCKTCSLTSLSACTSCPNALPYLSEIDYSCNAQCPDQTATVNMGNGAFTCKQCSLDSNCKTCEAADLSVCLSCPTTFPYLNVVDKKCYASCPLGYSKIGTNCMPCSANCKYCKDDNVNYCIACEAPTPYLNTLTNTCMATCVSPFFLDPVSQVCTLCNTTANCATCSPSNTNYCLSCDSNYPIFYPTIGFCYAVCPSGSLYNPSTKQCQQCNQPCATCEGTPDTCTSCINQLPYLLGSTCMTVCPSGYKTDAKTGQICVPAACDPQCQPSCTLPAYDESLSRCNCAPGSYYWQQNGTCIAECPAGYFVDSQRACARCFEGCASCTSATTCSKCSGNNLVLDQSCVAACPSGYYHFEGRCQENCPYFVYNTSYCVVNCPAGMIGDASSKICLSIEPKVAIIAPFSFILTVLLFSGLIIAKRRQRETLFFSNSVALVSIVEIATWMFLLILYFVEGFSSEGGIVVISVVLSLVLNRIFMRFYYRRMVVSDPNYSAWRAANFKQVKILELVAGVCSLRLLRIVFGKMTKHKFTWAQFSKEREAKMLFNNFALICILVGNLPVLLSNFLSFSSVIKKSQLFVCIIETSILSILQVFLTTFSYAVFFSNAPERFDDSGTVPRVGFAEVERDKSANHSVTLDMDRSCVKRELTDSIMDKSSQKLFNMVTLKDEQNGNKSSSTSGRKVIELEESIIQMKQELDESSICNEVRGSMELQVHSSNDGNLLIHIPNRTMNDSILNDSKSCLAMNESILGLNEKKDTFASRVLQDRTAEAANLGNTIHYIKCFANE